MATDYSATRKQWNAANYKQMNLSICPELLESFRIACEKNGASMRKVITTFMSEYAELPTQAKGPKAVSFNERKHRRKAVAAIIEQLSMIHDAEERYKENIPENLVHSSRYVSAEQAVNSLSDAIDLLGETY
jgi:hypothetical protein